MVGGSRRQQNEMRGLVSSGGMKRWIDWSKLLNDKSEKKATLVHTTPHPHDSTRRIRPGTGPCFDCVRASHLCMTAEADLVRLQPVLRDHRDHRGGRVDDPDQRRRSSTCRTAAHDARRTVAAGVKTSCAGGSSRQEYAPRDGAVKSGPRLHAQAPWPFARLTGSCWKPSNRAASVLCKAQNT